MSKGAKGTGKQSGAGDLVQCDACKEWIGSDVKVTKEVEFVCRMCKMEKQLKELEGNVCVDGSFEKRMKAVELSVADVMGRVMRLEEKLGSCCMQEVTGKLEEALSSGAVVDLKCEDRVKSVNVAVEELKDKVTAVEVKIKDLEEGGEWKEVVGRNRKQISVAAVSKNEGREVGVQAVVAVGTGSVHSKMTYADKVKANGKKTVLVLGDSLVRGVGKKLEAQLGEVFSAKSIGGARIETVTEEVKKLEPKDDRHLVIMVGTNNVKNDGSEIMLTKLKCLIEGCRSVRNRAVTMVGIPRRFGLNGEQEDRRRSVNKRLSKLCSDSGIEYVEYFADRSRICADGVHFNELGQREVAGMIFRHCRRFLL